MKYQYWEVNYISCEGNIRWYIIRTPIYWKKLDVKNNIIIGGCGDDISEVTLITQTSNTNYSIDYGG